LAGQPRTRAKRQAVGEYITERAIDDGVEPVEWLATYVGSGGTLVQLASDVTKWLVKSRKTTKAESQLDPVRREHVRRFVEGLGEEAAAAIAHARVHGGDALAEQVLPVANSAIDAQLGKLKTDALKYVAGVFNPALKDNTKQVNHTISLASEHLAALRRRQQARAVIVAPAEEAKVLPAQVVEAEVVSLE
jgi:hypothetical protein